MRCSSGREAAQSRRGRWMGAGVLLNRGRASCYGGETPAGCRPIADGITHVLGLLVFGYVVAHIKNERLEDLRQRAGETVCHFSAAIEHGVDALPGREGHGVRLLSAVFLRRRWLTWKWWRGARPIAAGATRLVSA